jgi:hypothetical protein
VKVQIMEVDQVIGEIVREYGTEVDVPLWAVVCWHVGWFFLWLSQKRVREP